MGETRVLAFVALLALLLPAAFAVELQTTFTTPNGTTTTKLDFQASDSPALTGRCYLDKTYLHLLEGSYGSVYGDVEVVRNGYATELVTYQSSESSSGEMTGTVEGGAVGERGNGSSAGATPKIREDRFEALIYGQLLDDKGRPLPGESVTVFWEDERNKTHSLTTTTLTATEAERFGDPSLIGYYFFSKQKLYAESDIIRNLRVERGAPAAETSAVVPSTGTSQAKPPPRQGETASPRPQPVAAFAPSLSERAWSALTSFFVRRWPILLIFVLVLGLVAAFILLTKNRLSDALESFRARRATAHLYRNLRELRERRVRELMTQAFVTAEPQESARSLVGKMLAQSRRFAVVLRNGSPIGVVTTADLLRKIPASGKDLSEVTVESLLSRSPHLVDAETPFAQALDYLLQGKVSTLLVVHHKRLLGVVSEEEFAAALDRFFALNLFTAPNMPYVKEAIKDAVIVREDDTVAAALAAAKDSSPLVILVAKRRTNLAGKEVDDLRGVVTEKALLEELYNYAGTLDKMTVEKLLSTAKGLVKGETALEANRELVVAASRILPVVSGNEILGVATQRDVLDLLHEYLAGLGDSPK